MPGIACDIPGVSPTRLAWASVSVESSPEDGTTQCSVIWRGGWFLLYKCRSTSDTVGYYPVEACFIPNISPFWTLLCDVQLRALWAQVGVSIILETGVHVSEDVAEIPDECIATNISHRN